MDGLPKQPAVDNSHRRQEHDIAEPAEPRERLGEGVRAPRYPRTLKTNTAYLRGSVSLLFAPSCMKN